MSPAEIYQTVIEGLSAFGSSGAMIFTFGHALANPDKLTALKEAFQRQF